MAVYAFEKDAVAVDEHALSWTKLNCAESELLVNGMYDGMT